MSHGKDICGHLKAVRQGIAEENGIALRTEECTYEGECSGTCPRCEAEVRYLEEALADRLRLGKVATVAGLAIGLAATAAQAQAPADAPAPNESVRHELSLMADSVTVRGVVRDSETNEEIPFCRVHLVDNGTGVDIDTVVDNGFGGGFAIRVPKGEYRIHISHFGYKDGGGLLWHLDEDTDMGDIMLEQGSVPVIMIGGTLATFHKAPEGHVEYYQGVFGTNIVVR